MLANRMNLAEESSKTIEAVVPRIYVNLPSGVPADLLWRWSVRFHYPRSKPRR